MKKYKMFNKGASKKDFAEYPRGKWTGNTADHSLSDSSSNVQTDPNKNPESFNSTSESPAQNSTPQTASNSLHYDHYHIAQGELSNKVETNDSSSNLSWHPNQSQKADGSSQLSSNELPDRLRPKIGVAPKTSVECAAADESGQNDAAVEPSTVMTVALGEIGSISKYVSQGIVSMPEMLTTPPLEDSSDVPVPATHSEGEDDSNIEMQPELTIISAFSLSAEMWENGQDKKPEEEETVEPENKDLEQCLAGEGISNGDQNSATNSEEFDISGLKKEMGKGSLSCTHCGTVSADPSSHQEHLATHAVKKNKVYLHQCSVSDCNYSTNVIREFISHYSVKHAELTSYVCRWCKSVMNSLSVFVDHVRENFVVPWVKCPHCYLKKKNKSEVIEHIAAEHPGESQRVIAGSMFLCRSSSHSREKDSKIVSESHKTLVSLLSNQKYILNHSSHNGKDSIIGIMDPNVGRHGYQCTDCLFNTTNAQVFLAHVKVCDSMKNVTKQRNVNFECKECSFATSSREAFLNHGHVKASLTNGMKRAPYKKRPAAAEVRNHKLIRKKVLNIKKQSVALKLKKDKEATTAAATADLEASRSPRSGGGGGGREEVVVVAGSGGHFKFSCPYCKEKFPKLNRMKFHIFLNHRDSYGQTFPLHQCLACHMKSSSEEIVRQHIERTHFGRKSGILLINEPPEIIPRKCKTPNVNKKLVKAIAPTTIKSDPSGKAKRLPKKSVERCSSWGRAQTNDDSKHIVTGVASQETKPQIIDVGKHHLPADDKESQHVGSQPNNPVPGEEIKPESNVIKDEDVNGDQAPPPKSLAMEIVKFTPGDHFSEYIECPQCSYQSRSVMGFYGHIKRHPDLVVHISTRRKYEFHKTKGGSKTEGEDDAVDVEGTETPSPAAKPEIEESPKENPDEMELKECLSPMSPVDPEIKDVEMAPPPSNPPKLESIIINKKSENLIDKDEYSKLGGPILNAKLSSLYTSDEHVKECNLCGFMAYFPCYIHRHLLSAHLNIQFWECGYCIYRHLQRYKVVRHCARNHANREPYVKWLGIPDWEKKLAACVKRTKPDEGDNPAVKTASKSLSDTPASSDEPPCSPSITDTPEVDGSEPDRKTVPIKRLPGNLFKCGSCTMCSIDVTQVTRHIRYQHHAEGLLPRSESESGCTTSGAAATVPQKPLIPSSPTPQKSARPLVSAPSTVALALASSSAPVLKKSPADQAGKKSASIKAKPRKKMTSSFAVPKTPYRCVFCNYVNMSATEVKKHMWQEHSDELNNVGILLKSKEESEKAPHTSPTKAGKAQSSMQKAAPVKCKLKRSYRPQKRKKTKTYAKCIKEPGKKKKSLAKSASESGSTEAPPTKLKAKKKYVKKVRGSKEVPPSEVSLKDSSQKRPAANINCVSPVMPKKRQIQSTQHSDYEWESPSLAEPPNSKSERIYKPVEKTEEASYRVLSGFEKSFPEKESVFKSKKESPSDVPLLQEYNSPGPKEAAGIAYNMTMPVFRKSEMDIYKRFIFKTYDGIFLCNYCLVSMSDEIEARHHILEVHPKKPTNPLEQPCKTFQLFRKKTRRPEVIVPHAAQPRVNQKPLQNGGVQKKGSAKNKIKSSPKLEGLVSGIKKENENRASLFEMFEEDLGDNQGPPDGGFQDLTSGRFDENDADQTTLLKVEGDMNYVFTWKWSDQDDAIKPPPQCCTDSEQVSVLRLITYRQGKNVTGHFKCPFCQLTSTSHISVSDHIRLDHMELERQKCRECPFKSWFSSLLENHRRLQHIVSPFLAANEQSPPTTKEDTHDDKAEHVVTQPAVQAPFFAQELRTGVDSKEDRRSYSEIHIVTDYRTLYLRKYCQKTLTVIYVCKLCSLILSDQNAFLRHLSDHPGQIYSCTACSFKAKPKSRMELHFQNDHPSLKPNLLVLRHESLINVTDNPHPEQIDKLAMDPPLIPPPWVKERPHAMKLPEQLNYACSDCPLQLNCLNMFSWHVAYHWNEQTIFSSEAASESTANSGDSALPTPAEHFYKDCNNQGTRGVKKAVDFAVRVKLSDIYSYYSDNVFSFYS